MPIYEIKAWTLRDVCADRFKRRQIEAAVLRGDLIETTVIRNGVRVRAYVERLFFRVGTNGRRM